MKKSKIDSEHYLELLDRLHVQSCMIEEHLFNHPLTKKNKKIKNLIDKAGWALIDAYQIVGEKMFENEKKSSSIEKVILGRRKKSKH